MSRPKHAAELAALASEADRHHRLCELNVVEQVVNVCQTTVVSEAWAKGRTLAVHGWIYKVTDGLLRDLGLCVTRPEEVASTSLPAIAALIRRTAAPHNESRTGRAHLAWDGAPMAIGPTGNRVRDRAGSSTAR